MAVFITVHVKGKHDALLAAYDRIADYEESTVPELRCHVCAKTADGMLVSGVWETREAFDRLLSSAGFQALLAETGVAAPEVRILEVYRSRH